MARRPGYWHTLQASKGEACLAVDLYNRLHEPRALEAFVIHMHLAWLYLLHAELTRDNVDFRYWDRKRGKRARLVKVNGEPKTWELSRCVENRWKPNDPVSYLKDQRSVSEG